MSNHTQTTIKQAIDAFLLSCKVEGKSYGTIECYSDKLKGFLWYTKNYKWPNDIKAITTNHLREFLAYLRETPHRFNSTCLLSISEMGHFLNRTLFDNQAALASSLRPWL
jgi:site-specific recombinase XerD